MFTFELHIPDCCEDIQIESEIEIKEKVEEVLESTDNFSSFFESNYFICKNIELIQNASLEINAYDLEWENYIYFLADILPDLVDSIVLIQENKSFSILFYEQGSERELHFIKEENNTTYVSYCLDICSKIQLGTREILDKKYIINILQNLLKCYLNFSTKNYPDITKKYIYPYLNEKLIDF